MNHKTNIIKNQALQASSIDPTTPELDNYTTCVINLVVEECARLGNEPVSYPYPDFYQKIKSYWQ